MSTDNLTFQQAFDAIKSSSAADGACHNCNDHKAVSIFPPDEEVKPEELNRYMIVCAKCLAKLQTQRRSE